MVNNFVKNKVNDTMVKRLHQFGLLKKSAPSGGEDT
jgi:hypothetical protein